MTETTDGRYVYLTLRDLDWLTLRVNVPGTLYQWPDCVTADRSGGTSSRQGNLVYYRLTFSKRTRLTYTRHVEYVSILVFVYLQPVAALRPEFQSVVTNEMCVFLLNKIIIQLINCVLSYFFFTVLYDTFYDLVDHVTVLYESQPRNVIFWYYIATFLSHRSAVDLCFTFFASRSSFRGVRGGHFSYFYETRVSDCPSEVLQY